MSIKNLELQKLEAIGFVKPIAVYFSELAQKEALGLKPDQPEWKKYGHKIDVSEINRKFDNAAKFISQNHLNIETVKQLHLDLYLDLAEPKNVSAQDLKYFVNDSYRRLKVHMRLELSKDEELISKRLSAAASKKFALQREAFQCELHGGDLPEHLKCDEQVFFKDEDENEKNIILANLKELEKELNLSCKFTKEEADKLLKNEKDKFDIKTNGSASNGPS